MVSTPDFIRLEYSDDLTQAGIAYGLRSLPYFQFPSHKIAPKRLRQIVASKGVELAFKRYLVDRGIPHSVWRRTRFANPEDSDLELGGRECVLRTEFLSERDLIQQVHQTPEALLSAQVAVPSERVPGVPQVRDRIYVFAFLTGLLADTRQRVEQALESGQEIYLVHILPPEKFHAKQRETLGEIVLKCDTSGRASVIVGGQNAKRNFQAAHVDLPPRTRLVVPEKFFSLRYVRVEKRPDGVVGLRSPQCEKAYLISPRQWDNIWVYGMRIIFGGYLPGETFAREAHRLPPGRLLFSGRKTLVENLVFPVKELRPLEELFDRARKWAEDEG